VATRYGVDRAEGQLEVAEGADMWALLPDGGASATCGGLGKAATAAGPHANRWGGRTGEEGGWAARAAVGVGHRPNGPGRGGKKGGVGFSLLFIASCIFIYI
jgi:hypothetical protein